MVPCDVLSRSENCTWLSPSAARKRKVRVVLSIPYNYTHRVGFVNTPRVIKYATTCDMLDAHDRLVKARIAAGYATAADAARAMGIGPSGYYNHENGYRKLSVSAPRYAKFFRVSLEWLLTGKGDMKAKDSRAVLPILGKVGAGARVDMPDDPQGMPDLGDIEITLDGDFILELEGDSQWPRYLPGERIIVEGQPRPPDRLVNGYAVVQILDDGRRLLKMLRRGRTPGRFRLESHNAPPEEDVELLAAWRVKGVWYG